MNQPEVKRTPDPDGERGYVIYTPNLEWLQKHVARCKECGTVVMPQRIGTHCNCGRLYCQNGEIAVFDTKRFELVDF